MVKGGEGSRPAAVAGPENDEATFLILISQAMIKETV